ncbi:MAG: hypothetical protein R2761_25590 [Acidimicrobiales bacterium]
MEQVLGAVPRDQRCQCRTAGAARQPTPAAPGGGGGWLSRLRRR